MFCYFLIFLTGLAVGSFAGAIVYRLPRREQFVSGRSFCPNCGHTLKWYDLVPVFSFLILLGRCRYCRNKISWSYPAIELCSGAIALTSFLFLSPAGLTYWLFWVFVLELFLILAFIDLRYFVLPDSIMALILVVFAGYEILGGEVTGTGLSVRMGSVFSLGNLAGAVFLFLIFFLIWSFSNGRGIGLGDAKLAGLLGLIFGFWKAVFILYLAIAAGAIVGLALIFSGKGGLKTKLPLGAFVSFAVILFVLFGQGFSEKTAEFFRYLLFKINLF